MPPRLETRRYPVMILVVLAVQTLLSFPLLFEISIVLSSEAFWPGCVGGRRGWLCYSWCNQCSALPSFIKSQLTYCIHFLSCLIFTMLFISGVQTNDSFIHITIFFLKKIFYWCAVDLQCCAHLSCTAEWLSYTHRYIFFKIFFSIMVYSRRLDRVPALCRRTLLFIHSKCNSLHLPTPNLQSIPLPSPLTLGNHQSVLYVWSLFLFYDWFICAMRYILHICAVTYIAQIPVFVFLFLTYFT